MSLFIVEGEENKKFPVGGPRCKNHRVCFRNRATVKRIQITRAVKLRGNAPRRRIFPARTFYEIPVWTLFDRSRQNKARLAQLPSVARFEISANSFSLFHRRRNDEIFQILRTRLHEQSEISIWKETKFHLHFVEKGHYYFLSYNVQRFRNFSCRICIVMGNLWVSNIGITLKHYSLIEPFKSRINQLHF